MEEGTSNLYQLFRINPVYSKFELGMGVYGSLAELIKLKSNEKKSPFFPSPAVIAPSRLDTKVMRGTFFSPETMSLRNACS